jgi:N-acetylglucosamine kinase-like BadF-type ATPase
MVTSVGAAEIGPAPVKISAADKSAAQRALKVFIYLLFLDLLLVYTSVYSALYQFRNHIPLVSIKSREFGVNFDYEDYVNRFESVLALDLGQSGSRILLPTGEKIRLQNYYEPKSDLGIVLAEIFDQLGSVNVDAVILGLTGLHGEVHSVEKLGLVCSQKTNCRQVAICDDGLAWNLGALSGKNGTIIAAGGGTVAVSRNGEKFGHIDGKGYELGDQGSAYWIGLKSVRLAIKSFENRAPKTQLVDLAENFFGSLIDLPKKKLSSNQLHTQCIEFAEKVFQLIEIDDEATKILKSASLELAASAIAASKLVNLSGETNLIVPVGGIFQNQWLLNEFSKNVSKLDVGTQIKNQSGDALDGLIRIPTELLNVNNNLLKWWNLK